MDYWTESHLGFYKWVHINFYRYRDFDYGILIVKIVNDIWYKSIIRSVKI